MLHVISTTLDRQRAERFAAILDGSPDRSGPELFTDLLEITDSLQRMPLDGDIDPVFRDRLRGRLLAVAAVQPVPAQRTPSTDEADEADAPTSHRARRRAARDTSRGPVPRRVVVLVGIIVSMLTTAGVVAASTTAVPGSPLYGVKRAAESAQLALAGGDVAKGRLNLGFARTRAGEAQRVHSDAARLIGTLDAMDSATRRGARLLTTAAITDQDRAPLDAVDRFLSAQRPDVVALVPGLTDSKAHARALQSLALLDRLHARAAALRSTLPCPAPDLTVSDDLGPRPGACGATNPSRGGSGAPGASGGASGAPGVAPSPGNGLPGLPRVPGLPGTTVSTPAGVIPPGQPPPADVGSVVTGVLGQVLGAIGVSPPPLPPVPHILP